MGVPHLKTCCCCCTTETGSKVIGWLQTILSIIAVLLTVFALVIAVTHYDEPMEYEVIKRINGSLTSTNVTEVFTKEDIGILATSSVIYLLMAIMGIYLLVGVYKRNMSYVRFWVILSTILLGFNFVVIVLKIGLKIAGLLNSDIVQSILSFILSSYFILVVFSFYRDNKGGTAGPY